MTDEKVRHYEHLLREMLDRLSQEKSQNLEQIRKPVDNVSHNDIGSSSLPAEMVGGSESDEEVALGLYRSFEATHSEVQAALQRIADGSFGRCEKCSKPIAQGRLEAVPYARRCAACARD
jgi:DnaK suppressor protein